MNYSCIVKSFQSLAHRVPFISHKNAVILEWTVFSSCLITSAAYDFCWDEPRTIIESRDAPLKYRKGCQI